MKLLRKKAKDNLIIRLFSQTPGGLTRSMINKVDNSPSDSVIKRFRSLCVIGSGVTEEVIDKDGANR
jgi:hypothetical protein